MFSRPTHFDGATFRDSAHFEGTTFRHSARFNGATFRNWANFNGVTFQNLARFDGVTFNGATDLSNAAFRARTVLARAKFVARAPFEGEDAAPRPKPPKLFGATLHEDTDWADIEWPSIASERQQALDDRRAYERLKLLMDDANKFHDEHFFFRKEMACWEASLKPGLTRWSIGVFRWLSDYGWSLTRPLGGLGLLTLVGWLTVFLNQALAYGPDRVCRVVEGVVQPGHLPVLDSVKLAVSNTVGFLGFNRTFLRDLLPCLTPLSEIVAMVQTVGGAILVFLLVLSLRSRFRIK